MNLNQAIITASNLAYAEDADHVVTLHGNEWCISHFEDLAKQSGADMEFRIYGDGLDINEVKRLLDDAVDAGYVKINNNIWILPTDEQIRIDGQDIIISPVQ